MSMQLIDFSLLYSCMNVLVFKKMDELSAIILYVNWTDNNKSIYIPVCGWIKEATKVDMAVKPQCHIHPLSLVT